MIIAKPPTWKFWAALGIFIFLVISWVPEFFEYVVHENGNAELQQGIQSLRQEVEDLKEQIYIRP